MADATVKDTATTGTVAADKTATTTTTQAAQTTTQQTDQLQTSALDQTKTATTATTTAATDKQVAQTWPDDWREQIYGSDPKLLARLQRYGSVKDVANALVANSSRL